jgi:tetratricopeptide (TPR) repeat protein
VKPADALGPLAVLAVVAAAMVAGREPGPQSVSSRPAGRPTSQHETKDRISAEALAEMVRGPADRLAAGRRAEADAAFGKLLAEAQARGRAGSVRSADLLTAYGLELYKQGDADEGGDTRRAAIPWLRQAVSATRIAWGPNHPETALALQNLADVIIATSPNSPGPEAEQALREAYRIRLKALGAGNGETLYGAKRLADVLSAGPDAANVDPGRAAEATRLYRAVIDGISSSRAVNPLEIGLAARMRLARLEARTGRPGEALAEVERAARSIPPGRPDDLDAAQACDAFDTLADELAKTLKALGAAPEARSLDSRLEAGIPACQQRRPL